MIIVSDTSPVVSLAAIGQLDLLPQLYKSITLPQVVYNELAGLDYTVPSSAKVQTLSWIQQRRATNRSLFMELQAELSPNEAESVALALELSADQLLSDEHPSRAVATRFGLDPLSTFGVLLLAKRRGLLPAVQPAVAALIQRASFCVKPEIYAAVLQAAGEAPPV